MTVKLDPTPDVLAATAPPQGPQSDETGPPATSPPETPITAASGPPDPQPPETVGTLPALTDADVYPTLPDLPLIPGRDEFLSLAVQARTLAGSRLVPEALQNRPEDVLLVLLTGRDLGISPTAALRKCYVVDGKVTIAPALKLALVRAKGLGSIRPAPGNDASEATAVAYDPADRELGRVTVTVADMAKVKDRGKAMTDKSNWRNYPARMLWWRAAGWAVDDFFPEVAFGLYSPDELGAFTDEQGAPIDVREVETPDGFDPEERRRAARAAREAAAPTVAGAEQVEAWRARANALDGAARVELKRLLVANGCTVDGSAKLEQVEARHAGRVGAILSGLERPPRPQRPVETVDDGIADAVVLCEVCGEPEADPCACIRSTIPTDTPLEVAEVEYDDTRPFDS